MDYLDEITKATENIQNTTPAQAADARRTSLYNKYVAAKENVLTAPAAERDAEKDYYTAVEGSDGYAKRMSTRAAKEAAQLKARLTKAHAEDNARITDALRAYSTSAKYAANIETVVLAQLNDVIATADAVKTTTSTQLTNDRKTTFLSVERATVGYWDAHLTVAIWVLAAVYAKSMSYTPFSFALLTLLVASPWLMGFVAWALGRRLPPFNIYTTFST